MSTKPITFSATPTLTSAQARWMSPLRAHWPACTRDGEGPAPPLFMSVGLDDLLTTLTGTRNPADLPAAAVIAFSPGEPAWHIDRTVEALRTAHVPAIILMPDPLPWRSFQQGGVLFERWETEPAVLAAMLYALVERQRDFDLLEREVGLTRRCERSIREEMDRLHEELHLAASIQREFTTAPLPEIPGLAFSVLSRPVSFVSGDVCCLRDAGEGRLAFLVADAAGHGVPAALLTMVLTHALATHETILGGSQRLLEPAEVMTRLNRRLCEHCRASAWFATALYGIIDSRTRAVTIASAGHPRPIILGPHGAREIDTEGTVLGLMADSEFTQTSTIVSDRETLLLYTDGLECLFPESGSPLARGSGIRPGSLFREIHTAAQDETPEIILRRLECLMDVQTGSLHQPDDITAVAIAPSPLAADLRIAA